MDRLDTESALRRVFDRAKQVDEFEFACTLLRVRGLEDAGWDAVEESSNLMDQLLGVMSGDVPADLKMRLLLLLYCHATEMDDLYAVPANLLRVCNGERYSMDPFVGALSPDGRAAKEPTTKAKRVVELAAEAGMDELANIYGYFVENRVRNAFFHSSYTLTDSCFRITSGRGVNVDGVVTPEIPLVWLVPKIECAVNLSMHVIDAIREYRLGYTGNKMILGRMGHDGELVEVELLGGEGGLYGFHGSS